MVIHFLVETEPIFLNYSRKKFKVDVVLRSTSCIYLVFDRPLTTVQKKIKLYVHLPVYLATSKGLRPLF